ncbi:GT4_WlbH-like domain containing protein [Mycobacteriaceae bacterium]
MTSQRIAIVQDYVPRYRVGFFDRLVYQLGEAGLECVIVAGPAPNYNVGRGDAVDSAPWMRQVDPPRDFRLWNKGPRFFGYGTDRHWRDCGSVIFGLRGASVDLNLELLRKSHRRRKVGAWGHLSRSVNPPNAVDLAVERWQMRQSDHVFAYTQCGVDQAVADGIPRNKVTAVMNSIETGELIAEHDKLAARDLLEFCDKYGLTPGKIFAFIGGLDASKRIEFLMEALDILWTLDCDAKLLVVGRGVQEKILSRAVRRGQVVMFGYGGPAEKGLICRLSQALVNPGRIGLVAVDALAVGIPILTTSWKLHAPEYEYLEHSVDVFESIDDPSKFASLMVNHLNVETQFRERLVREYPTIDHMALNFAAGILEMLA